MQRSKLTSWRRMIRELRELCPAVVPVRVRRRPLSDCLGYCSPAYDRKGRLLRFDVVVDSRLAWDAAWQVLVHEWAHALAWQEGETVDDHGPEWALAYARVYGEMVG